MGSTQTTVKGHGNRLFSQAKERASKHHQQVERAIWSRRGVVHQGQKPVKHFSLKTLAHGEISVLDQLSKPRTLFQHEKQCFLIVRLIAINRPYRFLALDQALRFDQSDQKPDRPINRRLLAINRPIRPLCRSVLRMTYMNIQYMVYKYIVYGILYIIYIPYIYI